MSAFFVGYSNNILIISKLLHILFGVFIFCSGKCTIKAHYHLNFIACQTKDLLTYTN
jgi:hypothetical protein